jgi:hypothetical protein
VRSKGTTEKIGNLDLSTEKGNCRENKKPRKKYLRNQETAEKIRNFDLCNMGTAKKH